jgi:hypothetical protein
MTSHDQEDDLLKRYFLGELGEEQKTQVEQRLFSEDELFELAEAVEADLLDEYARGELPAAARRQIDLRLATSPRSRARLALVQDLTKVEQSNPGATVTPFRRRLSSPALRFAMAASLIGVLVAAGAARLAFGPTHEAVSENAAVAELSFSVDNVSLRGAGKSLPAAPLSPGGLRIDLGALPEEYPACDVTVKRGERTVFEKRVPVAQGSASILIPAGELTAGRYEIEVQGVPAEGAAETLIRKSFDLTAH